MNYVLHFSGKYYCVGNFAVKNGFNTISKKVWDIAKENLIIQGMLSDGRITFKKGHEPKDFKAEAESFSGAKEEGEAAFDEVHENDNADDLPKKRKKKVLE